MVRISFVGKGGAGKTTVSSLFIIWASQHLPTLTVDDQKANGLLAEAPPHTSEEESSSKSATDDTIDAMPTSSSDLSESEFGPVLLCALDGDLNMHLPRNLAVQVPASQHLSGTSVATRLRMKLRGTNTDRIPTLGHFKKTTPPARGSQLISATPAGRWFFDEYCQSVLPPAIGHGGNPVHLGIVGAYAKPDENNEVTEASINSALGTSCYHNNLSVLENVLSHTHDEPIAGGERTLMVVDMVAAIDSFATTLHAQFDLCVIVAEPTRAGVSVVAQFHEYARVAGQAVHDRLFVVGNKCMDEADRAFIHAEVEKTLGKGRVLGCVGHLPSVRSSDREGNGLRLSEEDNAAVATIMSAVYRQSLAMVLTAQEKLALLYPLHRKLSDLAYIRAAVGDISGQIDADFDMDAVDRPAKRAKTDME